MNFFRKHFTVLLLGLCITFLSSQTTQAKSCYPWKNIFKKNRSVFEKAQKQKRILVLPFINKTKENKLQWFGDAMRLGLFLMLEHAKDTDVIEQRPTQTTFDEQEAITLGKAAGADYVIAGVYNRGQGTLNIFVRYIDVNAEKQTPIEEEEIEWPSTQKYSELMVHMARRASKAFKTVRVDKKLLHAIQNKPRSIASLQYWTLAQLTHQKGSDQDILQAQHLYQEALKNDFNYCYAYLGYAQTLAETGFMQKVQKKDYRESYQMAQRELSKATLLCPHIAGLWAERVAQYLAADTLHLEALDLINKGQQAAAQQKLSKALTLLPGDINVLQATQQTGGANASQLSELTQCR